MISIQITLLTIIAIGYISKRMGVLKKEDAQPLSIILINLMLPALIISAFSKTNITGQLGLLTLSAFIINSILLLFGWLISRKYERKTSKTFTILTGTYWGATLAFPFIIGLYGEEGIKSFLFYDIVQALFISSIFPYFLEERMNLLDGVKKVSKNPLFISLLISLIFNYFKISTDFLDDLLLFVSKGIVFVGLLIVGLNIELDVKHWKKPIFIIISKTVIGSILGLIIINIFGFTGINRTILMIAVALPPSLMAVIFSQKYHLDTRLAADTLTLALPVSIVTMSIISTLF